MKSISIFVAKSIITMLLLSITSSVFSAPEMKLASKDWGVFCEEDVFDDAVPFECFLFTIGGSGMATLIERDPLNNLVIRFLEKATDEKDVLEAFKKIDINLFVKVDKGELLKTTARYAERNEKFDQIKPKIDSKQLDKLLNDMKGGTNLNLKVEIFGQDFVDKFSLSGFTKAYNYLLEKDTRRPKETKVE